MRFRAILLGFVALSFCAPSWAQGAGSGISYRGWGLRVGAADSPDQVVGKIVELLRKNKFLPKSATTR